MFLRFNLPIKHQEIFLLEKKTFVSVFVALSFLQNVAYIVLTHFQHLLKCSPSLSSGWMPATLSNFYSFHYCLLLYTKSARTLAIFRFFFGHE